MNYFAIFLAVCTLLVLCFASAFYARTQERPYLHFTLCLLIVLTSNIVSVIMGILVAQPFDFFNFPDRLTTTYLAIGPILTVIAYALMAVAYCMFDFAVIWLLLAWIASAKDALSPRSASQARSVLIFLRFMFVISKVLELACLVAVFAADFSSTLSLFYGYCAIMSIFGFAETVLIVVAIWLVLAVRKVPHAIVHYKSNQMMTTLTFVYIAMIISYTYGVVVNTLWVMRAFEITALPNTNFEWSTSVTV